MTQNIGHLRLKDLVFHGRHGHFEFERKAGNRFEVDVDLQVDLTEIASNDSLEATVDLAEIYEIIRNYVEGDPCVLVETLANVIAGEIVAVDKVRECTVKVRKMFPPLPGATSGVMEAEVTRVA